MGKFNEISRKNVSYDNIKSHKKPGFYPLLRRYIFWKTTAGVRLTFLPLSCFRVNLRCSSGPGSASGITWHMAPQYRSDMLRAILYLFMCFRFSWFVTKRFQLIKKLIHEPYIFINIFIKPIYICKTSFHRKKYISFTSNPTIWLKNKIK